MDILKGLASRDPYDQYFAMLSLAEEGRLDLLPRLIPLCQRSRFTDVRCMAILTIGDLGASDASSYCSFLLPLLADPDPDVRHDAAESLGTLGLPKALAELRRVATEDSDPQVRERAGKSARLIFGDLLPGDEDPEFRMMTFDPYHRGLAA